jgi:hypothetical protein
MSAAPLLSSHAANAYSCSSTTLKLAERDLERSGLSIEAALCEGIFPTDDASTVCPDFARAPALILPYFDTQGAALTFKRGGMVLPFCRARYLGFPLPRARKYDQPGDSGTPPYFPRSFDWNTNLDACCCVEGEKKALALCRAGIPTVAIGGVFNYADGSAPLHPELEALARRCRDIFVLFDSDAAENPKIQLAEWRLAGQLALAGARPHVVRIPPNGQEKLGADDYLLEHGAAALLDLVLNTPPLGETTSADAARDEIAVADILSRGVAPVEQLIPGWVEKGVPNFIAGPGGVHKSRLALQWGLCINAGAAVWGIEAGLEGMRGPKATLVYCAAEDDANELARRAQAISAALKLPTPKQGVFLARKGADSALVIMHENAGVEVRPFFHRLVGRLQSIPGHKVVVLDSAYDFVRFAGHSKIEEDAVNYFIKVVLQRLCDETGSTLLIPWHPSQAGSGRDTMDGWSVAWHNAPRARLALGAVDGVEDTYELKVVKRNHGPKGQPLRIKFYSGALLPCDAIPDDGKAASVRKACVDAATHAASIGAPLTKQRNIAPAIVAEIAKRAGVPLTPKTVKDELEAACFAQELTYQVGYGRKKAGYFPVETGVETALRPAVETV